jgi:phosphoglycerol transferase MdoB-like AlkP superfamily enzyme
VLLPKIIKCRFNYYRKLQCRLYETYGNEQNITPFLDSLAKQSLLLLIFYASGNRTVQGLEAVTLCFPPTAGESIVKEKTIKQIFNGNF